MKYAITTSLIIIVILSVMFLYPKANVADANYIYVMPQVYGGLTIVGDYIYFISSDTLKKYNKVTLEEEGSLSISNCSYGVSYSYYLDKLIVDTVTSPRCIKTVDYNNMEFVDEYFLDIGPIGDIKASSDKLYIAWDNSGIEAIGHYNQNSLPENTGILSEYNISNMTENWSVSVATMPTGMSIAGDYIIVCAEEQGDNESEVGFPYVYGTIVSVVNRINRSVTQFPAGYGASVPSAYDGINKFYIANYWGAYYANEYGDADEIKRGLSILDLSSMDVEHYAFETNETIDLLTYVSHAAYDNGMLYLTYFDSKYNGTTYYGKFNTVTKKVENVPLTGLDQFLIYVVKDGNNLYFVTTEGWLIKYTFDNPPLVPPVACFTYYPVSGPSPLLVTIDNCSYDEDGEIVRIDCDWDADGEIDEVMEGNPDVLLHTFNEPGTTDFILTVVDNDELEADWTGSVDVV